MDYQSVRNSVDSILNGCLTGALYRNAGELPIFENPIFEMKRATGFNDMSETDQAIVTTIALGMFRNTDYPGRGTIPGIEHHVTIMILALEQAITQFVTSHRV